MTEVSFSCRLTKCKLALPVSQPHPIPLYIRLSGSLVWWIVRYPNGRQVVASGKKCGTWHMCVYRMIFVEKNRQINGNRCRYIGSPLGCCASSCLPRGFVLDSLLYDFLFFSSLWSFPNTQLVPNHSTAFDSKTGLAKWFSELNSTAQSSFMSQASW